MKSENYNRVSALKIIKLIWRLSQGPAQFQYWRIGDIFKFTTYHLAPLGLDVAYLSSLPRLFWALILSSNIFSILPALYPLIYKKNPTIIYSVFSLYQATVLEYGRYSSVQNSYSLLCLIVSRGEIISCYTNTL